jgi:hypothetical protein
MLKKVKCPHCGTFDVAEYLYGMPAYTKKLEQDVKNKKIIIGGCLINECAPKYYCNHCRKEFGFEPTLYSKNGTEEDYRDIVDSIYFKCGACYGPSGEDEERVFIKKQKNKEIIVEAYTEEEHEAFTYSITEGMWGELLDALYCQLFLAEWRKHTFVDHEIQDGSEWELRITLTNMRKRMYSGLNAYPPLWQELENIFKPFLHRKN